MIFVPSLLFTEIFLYNLMFLFFLLLQCYDFSLLICFVLFGQYDNLKYMQCSNSPGVYFCRDFEKRNFVPNAYSVFLSLLRKCSFPWLRESFDSGGLFRDLAENPFLMDFAKSISLAYCSFTLFSCFSSCSHFSTSWNLILSLENILGNMKLQTPASLFRCRWVSAHCWFRGSWLGISRVQHLHFRVSDKLCFFLDQIV